MKKKQIPKAIREQVWIEAFGKKFKHKCYITWCKNQITVFNPKVREGLVLFQIYDPFVADVIYP